MEPNSGSEPARDAASGTSRGIDASSGPFDRGNSKAFRDYRRWLIADIALNTLALAAIGVTALVLYRAEIITSAELQLWLIVAVALVLATSSAFLGVGLARYARALKADAGDQEERQRNKR